MKKIIFIVVGCLTLAVTSIAAIASMNPGAPQAKRSALAYDQTVFAQGTSEGGVNVYKDPDNNEYIFNEKGEQIGYKRSDDGIAAYAADLPDIDLDQAVAVANDILSHTIETYRNYTITEAQYIDDLELYSIGYNYIVNGYRTSDFAFMFISKKGELMSYAAPNVGSFSDVVVPEINRSEIEQYVYDQVIRKYDCIDCSITDMMLIKKGGSLKLSVSYYVTLSDNTYFGDAYCVDLE